MKKLTISLIAFAFITSMFVISGCVKNDFDTPPIVIPKVDFPANTTIAGLKATYTALDSIKDYKVIKGRVVANDESGNLYKKICIQDETGAIELELDQTSLYTTYRLGQMIYVKCQGMYIGDYHGYIQLGGLYNGAIGRLAAVNIKSHLYLDSLPGASLVPAPKLLTIPTIASGNNSMLVKFVNVKFSEIGQTFATTTATTNRTLTDDNGNSLTVRTSNYADFAANKIPGGKGTVIGIMGVFDGTWQLTLRDSLDVQGFTPVGPNPGGEYSFPDPGTSVVTSVTENFDNAVASTPISITGWTNVANAGTRTWQGKIFAPDYYAQATSYNTTDASNIMWLITPPITYNSALTLSFKSAIAYWVQSPLSVYVLIKYNPLSPSTAQWIPVTTATLAGSTSGNYTWVPSGTVNLSSLIPSGYTGNFYVAFKYKGDATNTTTSCIDEVHIQ